MKPSPGTSTNPAEREGRRCILNVATGPYVGFQKRLLESLRAVRNDAGVKVWTDEFPPDSPSHEEVPYGFKLFAIRQALLSHLTSVLWLDSVCRAVGSLDPVFERIWKDGHCLVAGEDRLGNWASDACLAQFELTRDQAMHLRLMNGSFIGLDLDHPRSRQWYESMMHYSRHGLFQGPYLSTHAPAEIRARKPGKPVGFVSEDPRCWGHRHDEAVGSCLAYRYGLEFTPLGNLFDIGSSPGAVVRVEA